MPKMDNEKLIETVRSLPCLWQVRSKAYRDQKAKESAWKQVAEAVHIELHSYIATSLASHIRATPSWTKMYVTVGWRRSEGGRLPEAMEVSERSLRPGAPQDEEDQ